MNELFVKPDWNVSNNVKIIVTTKKFYDMQNFNLSYFNNNYEKTKNNRDYIRNNFLPTKPNFARQVHGKKIITLDGDVTCSYTADGLITKEKNKVIAILTADCIPVVISSICGNMVCILHVGRKGAEYNIINNAFNILNKYNYEFEAWIGPAISKKYYTVDNHVKNLFLNINSKYGVFFNSNKKDLFNMDLIGMASLQLMENNIKHISYSNLCTVKNNKDFYSHRHSSDIERFGTFVWFE
jgi:YfiH family protein